MESPYGETAVIPGKVSTGKLRAAAMAAAGSIWRVMPRHERMR